MGMKIAIASTDGKVINEHFGRANRFMIFEVCPQHYEYKEWRKVQRCCHSGEHEFKAFEEVARVLIDCMAIVVAKIGESASHYMESKGFIVFEAPYWIEDVLQKMIEEHLLESEEGENGNFIRNAN